MHSWKVAAGVLLVACTCAGARAQDQMLFSLSGSGNAGFGTLDKNEIGCFDSATKSLRPWLRTATGAFFAGDVNGDGKTDELPDVDDFCVLESPPGHVNGVLFTLSTSFGGFQDGDILQLTNDGRISVYVSEATLVTAFGIVDGNIDVDGLHQASDGKLWLSFDSDEASTVLSTDSAGVITDGSIVWYDPVTQQVGVFYTEADVDAMVSNALGKPTTTGDTLSIAADSTGTLCFTVQSPSSDDASVFSVANGGSLLIRESDLGFTNAVEVDGLDLRATAPRFLAAHAATRAIQAGGTLAVDLYGPPSADRCVLLLGLQRGDADAFPFDGFRGLALAPSDPLFTLALSFPWLYGATDASGHASFVFPPAPPGVIFTLFAQAYDLDAHDIGTPIAVEFEG